MATVNPLYYNSSDHHNYIVSQAKGEVKSLPAKVTMPNVPLSFIAEHQPIYQQHCLDLQIPSAKRIIPEHNLYPAQYIDDGRRSTAQADMYHFPGLKPPSTRPLPRSENLKRRPSLREAARSIRSSRVVKRLRRQGKTELDPEDGGDAGASSSESDHSADFYHGYQMGLSHIQEPPRSASVVSELSSGLQSSLTLTPYSRQRGSSTVSQASTWVVDNSDSASINTSFTTHSSNSKRSRQMESEDLERRDDEDESDRIHKRACSIGVFGPEQPQLFACPFAKHDPHRYSAANLDELNYRGCSQSYLTDLARVKQHLYRVHERPPHHCPTCYEIFKSQSQCIKHVNLQSCHTRPCPFDDKMTPLQLAAIKKKNRGTDPYQGWYDIYKTLFAGSHLPHSPYAAFTTTVDTLEAFMDFMIQQLPTRLQSQLQFNASIVNEVQGSLPEVLREIRRDFGPFMQQTTETIPRKASEVSNAVAEAEGAHTQNYHYSATLPPSEPNQQLVHAPTINLPPHIYLYPATQSGQGLAEPTPSHAPYHDQRLQQDVTNNYADQQFNYSIPNQSMMAALDSGPQTAYYQPDIHENPHGYFAGQHRTEIPVPTYSLQIEHQDNWIPNMVTIEHSTDDNTMQTMMGEIFPGEFSHHSS